MPEPPRASEPPPQYTKYRARPRLLDRGGNGLGSRRDSDGGGPGDGGRRRVRGPRGPLTPRRVLKWFVLVIVAWILLSFVLFLISAQIQRSNIPDDAKAALNRHGTPPFSATTVLVLGSDQRPKGSKEPGASTSGPSRSDSIMLMRVGGGHNARLSIPRDTLVDIPGHGRAKINAAYAFGGPALAIRTVEGYLGIKIDHLVNVSFTNFPKLIDAMGGINYTGGCVHARVDGGYKNGGVTLHLTKGTHHLDGKQALALSRVRENLCNPKENEYTRERRQQKIISAMKHRLLSVGTFLRLPWVTWNAPKALQTDMAGPSLMGLFASLATSGSPPTRVLLGTPEVVAGVGDTQVVSAATRQKAVEQFLR